MIGPVNGQPAVSITLSDATELAVASTRYQFQMMARSGTLNLSNYNSVPEITAPTDRIDPDQLNHSASADRA